ncbi:MAG: flagellar hook-basal body complex protein, partial [Lachnospiraceae bacterium]|nr:flagellar hook-basal body complex protein [Lachnospiraceae bacterium]
MMRSLWSAASGMKAQQTNTDVIANNLANVNTVGFKTSKAEFKTLLSQTVQQRAARSAVDPENDPVNVTTRPAPAQVGLGTRVSSTAAHFTQGSLEASDLTSSFAIEGKGFF